MSKRLAAAAYAILKRAVFTRDGWRCRYCTVRQNLHSHHIIFRSHGGEDTTDNLITICNECHEAVHDRHPKFKLAITRDGVVDANKPVQFMKSWKGTAR